jgi:hypothetical protein
MDNLKDKNMKESYITQVKSWTNDFITCLTKKQNQPDLECEKILNHNSVDYFLKYYKEIFEDKKEDKI